MRVSLTLLFFLFLFIFFLKHANAHYFSRINIFGSSAAAETKDKEEKKAGVAVDWWVPVKTPPAVTAAGPVVMKTAKKITKGLFEIIASPFVGKATAKGGSEVLFEVEKNIEWKKLVTVDISSITAADTKNNLVRFVGISAPTVGIHGGAYIGGGLGFLVAGPIGGTSKTRL